MDDAGIGRDHAEVLERSLAPAQERVSLAVPLEFELGVSLKRKTRTENVHLHGVIDDEFRGHQRIDASRIAA